jgi:hypothetical protein
MDAQVLLVALLIDPVIGWLGTEDFWLLPEGWPFLLFASLFAVGGALLAVLLFPVLAGGNIIATMIVAAIGAVIGVILFVIAWCLGVLYAALRHWDGGDGF